MNYKDFIKVDDEFQYSINLQYDLNKLTKIDGYIPTGLSLEILKMYIQSVYKDSKERSTVLIGPYGKGKSHLLLILLAILSLKDGEFDNSINLESGKVITRLIEKIGSIDNGISEVIKELRQRGKRLLPIIINSNYTNLNQSFLIALKSALEREGLTDLFPNTYFDAVIKTINIWEDKYQKTFEQFKQKLNEYNLNINKFKTRINRYDEKAYKIFRKIHPQITSGTEFNPLINSDVVKLYEEVNIKLCETLNYTGMFIVFDEFSKFIEASVERNAAKDIKIIQDIAELANRSGKNQIHLVCITHKVINDYIAKLPQEKIDAWRTVEGRFKEIYFTSSSQQNYELIANAIKKDKNKFEAFLSNFDKKFYDNINNCSNLGLFDDVYEYEDMVGRGCFPLNPLSAYVLPRVSEKVAQNERTLFTFLARDEKGSLVRFMNEHDGRLKYLTLDWIYDYFEALFKKEVFNQSIHLVWLKASTLLGKINNEIEIRIVKAIAIIYIVNELDKLSPIDVVIQNSISVEKDDFDEAVKELLNKNILRKRSGNGFYNFSSKSYANINKEVLKVKETKASKINVSKSLEEVVSLGYILPKRYNDNYEMIRFFENVYITVEELDEVNDPEYILKLYKSDGVILNLIYSNEDEKQRAIEKIRSFNNERILLCLPNSPFIKYEELKEFVAIQYLKNDDELKKQDDLLEQELLVYELDLTESIEQYVRENFDIQFNNCKFYMYDGVIEDINKPSHVNRKISEICERLFSRTPIINNEMINKMNPSTQMVKARNKIIQYIFEEMDKEDRIELSGSGPEATTFRATIKNKGLNNSRLSNDDNLNEVLSIIERFTLSCEESKKLFDDLYDTLTGENYGIRTGIIPIYLALIFKDFKNGIVVYNGDKEVPLTVDTLNAINSTRGQYYLLLEKGTNEKEMYVKKLNDLFKEYRDNKEIGYNRFSNIVASMQNWIKSLPKYSREFEVKYTNYSEEKIGKDIISLRKDLLKFEINPREFLFDRIKNKILREDTLESCYKRIESIKTELDVHIDTFRNILIEKTKMVFDKSHNGEFSTLLQNWYRDLSDNSKKHVYDIITNNILEFLASYTTHNDNFAIEKMARIITGLNIEDWNDNTFNRYLEGIKRVNEVVKSYKDEVVVDKSESYEISFKINGKKVEKMFEIQPISPLGNTLLDDIEQNLEDYGESIDINEKRNILMELMKRLM